MKNAKKFTLCKHLPAFLLVCFFALSALVFGEWFAIRSAAADGYVYDLKGRTFSTINAYDFPSNTVTIKDSIGTGSIGELQIHGGSTITLESGTIDSIWLGYDSEDGGTLIINGGTVHFIGENSNSFKAGKGNVIMNGGTIDATDKILYNEGGAVHVSNFTMNGGTIKTSKGHGISIGYGSNTTVNGGTIDAAVAIGSVYVYNSYMTDGYTDDISSGFEAQHGNRQTFLTINGGTFNGNTTNSKFGKVEAGAALDVAGLSEITIRGGSFNGSVLIYHNDKLSIDKATFSNPVWFGKGDTTENNKSITISGGNFKNGLDLSGTGDSTILIKNGTFSSTDDEALNIENNGDGHNTVTIENGTFSSVNRPALQTNSYKGISTNTKGSNTVTIENGTFKSTESNSVDIDENSTFTVKGGTFTGTLWCDASSTASTSPLKLSGGTFYPAKSTERAKIILSTDSSSLDILSTLASGYCFKPAGDSKDYLSKDRVEGSSIKIQSGTQQFRLAFRDYDNIEGAKVYSDTKFITDGSSFGSLPTPPARTGYTFRGWVLSELSESPLTSTSIFHWKTNGKYLNYVRTDGSDLSAIWIYASWTKTSTTPTPTPTPSTGTTYKVSFNANGGKKVASTKKLKTGQVYGALPKTSRKGYTFLGWYTAKTKGTKVTAKTKFTRKSNLTLYAHWKYTTYKITYKTQKGKLSGKYKKTYQMITKTFKLPTPKRTGYTFRGWSTSASKFKKVTQIKKGTTGNKTFYAWWKKATAAPTLSSVLENMVPGQTITLTTTGTITSQITWKSSDSSVATVKNGIVIAKKAGTAIITMNCMNFSKTCIIKVSSKTSTPSKATTYKAPGLNKKYVVGVDIPAGEYYMKPTRSYDTEIVIYKNGKTKSFYDQDTYGDSAIITLSKGTSVSYKGLTAVPISQSKKLASTKKEGMFKVGVHIPAGTYTLKSREGFDEGYYYIYNSSKPNADYDIESFTGTTTITLKKGQYLKLSFATIVQ